MRLALDKKWTERLLDLPESGMGYQSVRVCLKDGRTLEDVVVLNAQVLQVPDDAPKFASSDIATIEPSTPTRAR